MDNLNEITATEKSQEQIASENNLDFHIADDTGEFSEDNQQSGAQFESGANDALFGVLSIIPIGLNIAGLKNTAGVWNEGVCRGIADAAIPVLRKYTFGQKIIAFLETGGGIEEFALVMAFAPVAFATVDAYQADIQAREKEVKDAEEANNDVGNG